MKISKSFLLTMVGMACFFVVGTADVFAGAAALFWNANTDDDLAGYRIYYDTSSHASNCPAGYPHHIDVTVDDNTGYWLDNLTPGQNYYFQITALDLSGNESSCSTNPGEVSKLINSTSIRSDVDSSAVTNTADALLILRNSVGLAMDGTSWHDNKFTGDANCDASSNSADALLALRYSLGLSMDGTSWCESD